MRHVSKAGAVLGLIFALLLCVPTVAAPIDSITPADLAGVWRWASSTGGVAGVTVEAELPLKLELSVDGKVRVRLDGGPLTEGTYELRDSPVGGQLLDIELEGDCRPGGLPPCLEQGFRVSLLLGVLRLAEPCCDLYSHDFPRDPAERLPVLPTSMGEVKARWEVAPGARQ